MGWKQDPKTGLVPERETRVGPCGHRIPDEWTCWEPGLICWRQTTRFFILTRDETYGHPVCKIMSYCSRHKPNPWKVTRGDIVGPMSMGEALVFQTMSA